ncbi:VapE domain-containing protein [Parabacteroides gordonii]|jgi:ABC-type dipeptide/oligopeptide/nickel transport system ATPase subunit|uniref:VapE domain-containing protein n=1 Tax=Parabacteroides gordonii TaxID=574930 RepID=UPI00241C1C05|nr:VapE domain-containing protein [Parabacteroides gordonii]
MKATLFSANLKTPRAISLESLAELIKDSSKAKHIIALQDELCYTMPGITVKQAKRIPVIHFCSLLKKQDGNLKRNQYNGLVLLKVNNLINLDEAKRIRNQASSSLQTLMTFIGSCGKSVKIVVPFTLPDGSVPQNEALVRFFHAEAQNRAKAYYSEQLQCPIVSEANDLEAACRLSYDPDLYYNPEALPIRIEQPWKMPDKQLPVRQETTTVDALQRLVPGYERSRIVSLLFENALHSTLNTSGFSNNDKDIKPFLTSLAESCFRSGIPEEDVIKWLPVHFHFRPFEAEIRTTVRNVYRLSSGFGMKPCIRPEQSLIFQVDEFMKRRYEFRYNVLKEDVEFRERRSYHYNFFPISEQALNSISLNAQEEGIPIWDRDVKRYVYSDRILRYSPIEQYMQQLPVWDGTDHIRSLADTLPCNNPEWRNQFYIWFLSMVAHWTGLDEMHANSASPLLVGKQGCGKSTWCRNLLPAELREYYTDSIDFSNKREAELLLNRFALINIDEFDSVSPSHQAFLKHILQKPVINARQPYKRSIHPLKRYASFIATSNNSDLLSDPTGSRRFICIEITGNINHNISVNHQQLYAQAAMALRNNERYWFTSEEETGIIRNNHQFQQTPVEEQLFFQYFRLPEPGEEGELLPAAEILRRIEQRSKIKSGIRNMAMFGRILLKNNVVKKHTKTENYYHVIELP